MTGSGRRPLPRHRSRRCWRVAPSRASQPSQARNIASRTHSCVLVARHLTPCEKNQERGGQPPVIRGDSDVPDPQWLPGPRMGTGGHPLVLGGSTTGPSQALHLVDTGQNATGRHISVEVRFGVASCQRHQFTLATGRHDVAARWMRDFAPPRTSYSARPVWPTRSSHPFWGSPCRAGRGFDVALVVLRRTHSQTGRVPNRYGLTHDRLAGRLDSSDSGRGAGVPRLPPHRRRKLRNDRHVCGHARPERSSELEPARR
jgi:hypothetical protein